MPKPTLGHALDLAIAFVVGLGTGVVVCAVVA